MPEVVPPPEQVGVPVTPPKAPTPELPPRGPSPLKTGLRAAGRAAAWMILFAALDYYVHEKLQEQLEKDIEESRTHMYSWGVRFQAEHQGKPVYLKVTVRSEEYLRYFPFLGWMPQPPELFMTSVSLTTEPIDPPVVRVDDHSLDIFHPGKTTDIAYTELLVPAPSAVTLSRARSRPTNADDALTAG